MCEVLQVSKSGYYRFLKRSVSAQETKRLVLLRAIEEIYRSIRNTYGSPRIYAQLKALGFSCSKSTIERLMRANGMVSKVRKKYKATMDAPHAMPIAPNRVNQKFQVEAPNQLWMGDITYLRTKQGWFYCYDNAVVESFFHTLKAELDERFSSREQARRQVFVWMEGFYNRNRLHSSLGYISPEQFENQRKFS